MSTIRGLSQTARDAIRDTMMPGGRMLTVAEFIRAHGDGKTYGNGANRRPVWTGDSCGCIDDRCIGHHHDKDAECGCLRVVLDQVAAVQA
jgi:hypothetical protein